MKRRMTAVLLADVVGYSRLMSTDEDATHVMLAECFGSLIEPKISEHGGRLIRSSGDGLLVEFDSALDAVRCGVEIQQELSTRNASVNIERRFQMRIGVNAGDVIVDERDIYGNSVNIAARLETLAKPGELFVTSTVHDQLLGHPDLTFEDKGRQRLRNIDTPFHVFRVERTQEQKPLSLLRRVRLAALRLLALFPTPRPIFVVTASAVVLAVAAIVAVPVWQGRDASSAQASIMVLPFRSMSNNRDEDYFADAITDVLTTDLSRMADTVVIARTTAFTYKGKSVDARQIGQDCDVRYLLEGSITKIGTRVHASTHLVNARSGVAIWADRFEGDVTDLFDLQQAVTGRIASSLGVQLVKAESRRREGASNPNAIDMRLRAMAILIDTISPESNFAARKYLLESLNLDNSSAIAWSQLADVYMRDYLNRWNADKDKGGAPDQLAKAEDAVQRAMSLDPKIPTSHVAQGFIHRAKGEHQLALEAFERAILLDNNNALAYAQKANQLALTGRPQEALPFVWKAMKADPGGPNSNVHRFIEGRIAFMMQNYDEAIVSLQKSIEARDTVWFPPAYRLSALALTGKQKEAEAALAEFQKKFPSYTLERIKGIYASEIPNDNQMFKDTLVEFYKGLERAGMK